MDRLETPSFVHPLEFQHWKDGTPQGPVEELLAEHHLMGRVLAAMDAEAAAMTRGCPLRAEFWSGVLEFLHGFVHGCHRAKEEQCFFPIVARAGLLPEASNEILEREHRQARQLTLRVCRLAEEGDWEGVARLCALYLHLVRAHMRREESELMEPSLCGLPEGLLARLRAGFAATEAAAFGIEGRATYQDLADELCAMTAIPGVSNAVG